MTILSQSVDCCLVLLIVSFALQKLLSYTRTHLSGVDLAIGVLVRKLSPVPIGSKQLPSFHSARLSVSGFALRSLMYLDLSFVQHDRYGSSCSFPYVDTQLNQHYSVKMNSLFHCGVAFFVKNQVSTGVWVYFRIFDPIPLINLFPYQYYVCTHL